VHWSRASRSRSFANESPIGREIVFSAPNNHDRVAIMGVARDAKYTQLRGATPPTVYMPTLQCLEGAANFALRIDGTPGAMFAAIRAAAA